MGRSLACLCPLLVLLVSTAAGVAPEGVVKKASLPGAPSSRLIVRFSDPTGQRAEGELLSQKVDELGAKVGVRHAKAYKHVGMAVAECTSTEAMERLARELDEDPFVELATPDTTVSLFSDDGAGAPYRPDQRALMDTLAMEEKRQCSAQSSCASLAGKCCPAADGLMLACCQLPKSNVVAFRSSEGKFMVAEDNGAANFNREKMDSWEKFHIYHNDDGTISLYGHFGKYLSAQEDGRVAATSILIGRHEKFHLIHNNDTTISLKTTGLPGKYLTAADGHLRADSRVAGASEKFHMIHVKVDIQLVPNDANFSALWGMDDPIEDKDIDAPEAWKAFHGSAGNGIIVAVIDTGIDYTHEDLKDAMWTNPNEIPDNGIDDDGNGIIDDVHGADFANEDGDPMDDQLHGTHCAGTIAGVGDNGKGVAGVAWRGVRLMALKFLTSTGGGRTSDAVKAIDYAVAHGAKILSNSWGGGTSSAALRIAIERAEASGVLFVAAAGNSGTNNDEDPQYPANYPSANVISVASTNPKGKLSGFSCYGAERVDVAAPGSGIFSTIPNQGYKFLSGTSMATPHVSGLAALIWMYRPQLSMLQVKEIVLGSVVHSDALEGKLLTGGRINARKALDVASSVEPPHPPKHGPAALSFRDADSKVGAIGGVVTITAAADESDVDYYKVYFVSRAGFQLDAIGNVTANGSKVLKLNFSSMALPNNADSIVAVAGNASGEVPVELGAGVPSVKLEDYGMPELGPSAALWRGDVDPRPGHVAGRLALTRAFDERTITSYNVYWSNSSSARGPLAGTVPAVGFYGPRCAGPSCHLINETRLANGTRFDRFNYTDDEMAVIFASGPGTVTVTRMDTEAFFDTLTVGGTSIYGKPLMPMTVPFPAGKLAIRWYSDESSTSKGWTFEVHQTEATVDFELPASKRLGRGLLVVPAYKHTELPQGLFVEVPDSDKEMPPSPVLAASSAMQRPAAPAINAVPEFQVSTAVDLEPRSGSPEGQLEEPWLRQKQADKERALVWQMAVASALSAASAGSRVFGSVVVRGLSAEAAAAPALRAAFEQAVAKAMPAALSPEVRLTRIFGASGDSSEVEFEARLAHGSSALALDRVEARIILLSVGGDSARHFEHGLLEALAAAGAKLPQGARVRVVGPKQVSPRKTAGRQLAASVGAPRRLHSAGSPMPSSARATAWIAVAICAASAVVPVLGLVAAIAATRRRFLRRNAETLSSHLASELEVERIEEGCEGLAGKAECE